MQNPKTQSIETCNKCSPPGNQKAKTHNFLPVYFGGNLRVLPYLMSFFLSGVSVAPVVGYLEKNPMMHLCMVRDFFCFCFSTFFFPSRLDKSFTETTTMFLFFKEKRLRAEQALFRLEHELEEERLPQACQAVAPAVAPLRSLKSWWEDEISFGMAIFQGYLSFGECKHYTWPHKFELSFLGPSKI